MRRAKWLAMTGLAAFVLVGCTSVGGGNPTPAPTTTGSSKTTTSAPASDRPAVIKLDGLDPCKALTTDNQKQLGTSSAEPESSDLIPGAASKACVFASTPGTGRLFSYAVDLVTGKGIEHWKGSGNQDVASSKVSDFPAKRVTFKGTDKFECSVAVDVADGQQLFVQYLPIGRDEPQETLCQKAEKGAELALATLQTLK